MALFNMSISPLTRRLLPPCPAHRSKIIGHFRPTSNLTRLVSTASHLKNVTRPAVGEDEEQDDLLASLTRRRGGRTKRGVRRMSPRAWLESEEGLKFRDPIIGKTNWLGGEIPFPSNPWFKPVPPLSDLVRTKVYESFKHRVQSNVEHFSRLSPSERTRSEKVLLRQTSEQWGISRERVAAVIRLKAMEESWTLPLDSEGLVGIKRTLQLNFEKGMEGVLGVEKDAVSHVNEDATELQNRHRQRKSSFYGTEFVPLDSPQLELATISRPSNDQNSGPRRYEETEPSEKRHVRGPDGLPRPPQRFVSKLEGKLPIVFTDVSKLPRAPRPISKRKARYYPKTPLFANLSPPVNKSSPCGSVHPPPRRSICTSTLLRQEAKASQPKTSEVGNPLITQEKTRVGTTQDKTEIATKLLRKARGCASSSSALELLDALETAASENLSERLEVDNEIVEKVLLRAGGLSFRKSLSSKPDLSSSNVRSVCNDSPEEKRIREIKCEMMKSIYRRKLELNSAGRLLLPKSIRQKEEHDHQILSSLSSPKSIIGQEVQRTAACPLQASAHDMTSTSNRLVRCMKGPLGRMRQRELAQRGSSDSLKPTC